MYITLVFLVESMYFCEKKNTLIYPKLHPIYNAKSLI